MDLIKGAVGGIIGGAIGAVIWALVAYNLNVESGWIAWGIGGLAGLGVAIGMGGKGGVTGGGLAILIAIVSIGIGKYSTVNLIASDVFKDADAKVASIEFTDEEMIESLVAKAAEDLEKSGKSVAYKNGKNLETAESLADYPDWIVKDRRTYFEGLSADDRAYFKKEKKDEIVAELNGIKSSATSEGFSASFSPFDILWAILAMVTAFRVGASEIG